MLQDPPTGNVDPGLTMFDLEVSNAADVNVVSISFQSVGCGTRFPSASIQERQVMAECSLPFRDSQMDEVMGPRASNVSMQNHLSVIQQRLAPLLYPSEISELRVRIPFLVIAELTPRCREHLSWLHFVIRRHAACHRIVGIQYLAYQGSHLGMICGP